jgi:hypothetical protein
VWATDFELSHTSLLYDHDRISLCPQKAKGQAQAEK